MIHACGACGGVFSCNGGRGSDCNCGEILVPRLSRRCRPCREGREREVLFGGVNINEALPNPFVNYDPPPIRRETYNVKEIELCKCNKCEQLLGRVRFI